MKEFRRQSGLIAVVATLCSGIAGAQQQSVPSAVLLDSEEEEVRRYSVELIVFEYVDGASSTELFEPDKPDVEVIPFSDAIEPGRRDAAAGWTAPAVVNDTANPDFAGQALESEIPDTLPDQLLLEPLEELATLERSGFEFLEPDEYQLDDIYDRLERLGAYRPLMRAAWIQPALEQYEAIPLKLRRIGDPPLRLNGTASLYLSRFLHLVMDVSLEEKSPVRLTGTEQRISFFGDNRLNSTIGIDPAYVTPSIFYRIQEDGLLRNGELRYYDHPKFGVLAQVSRVEEEEDETEVDTGDLLPPNR
jgi:hypothetical protein